MIEVLTIAVLVLAISSLLSWWLAAALWVRTQSLEAILNNLMKRLEIRK